jgi:hypothetical protein
VMCTRLRKWWKLRILQVRRDVRTQEQILCVRGSKKVMMTSNVPQVVDRVGNDTGLLRICGPKRAASDYSLCSVT